MASLIRSINELPTLRCSVSVRDRAPVLLCQPYIGADRMADQEAVPIDISGTDKEQRSIDSSEFVSSILNAPHDHPIAQHISLLDAEAADGVPLWLQIGQDSAEAAILPWSNIVGPLSERGVLRIPNFAKNPFSPDHDLRIAICVSAPRAKDNPDAVIDEVRAVLSAYRNALKDLPYRVRMSIFAPPWDTQDLWILITELLVDTGIEAKVIHLPEGDLEIAPRTRRISGSDEVTNPWLRWILAEHGDTGIDGMHFICPGYTSRGLGALAVSESPSVNDDTQWARFIGQNELMRFYDALAVSVMGFTPTGSQRWIEGIHRLAYQMSWARPGPIYVARSRETAPEFTSLLRGIWTPYGINPVIQPRTIAYVYPDLLTPKITIEDTMLDAGPLSYENTFLDDGPFVATHPELTENLGYTTEESDHGGLFTRNTITFSTGKRLSLAETEAFRRIILEGLEPSDEPETNHQRATRFIESERAKVSSVKPKTLIEQIKDHGTNQALDFLQKVLSK